MSTPHGDSAADFKLMLDINCGGKGLTESYYLTASNWTSAILHGEHIAKWRAAVLASDAELVYAVAAKVGFDRESKVCIAVPIAGGLGTKYPTSSYGSVQGKSNSPGVGFRVRFETADGKKAIRSFRAMPDGMVQRFKLSTTPNDAPNLGAYTGVYTMENSSLPLAEYWPVDDGTPPSNADDFRTWEESMQQLLKVLYNFTTFAVEERPTGADTVTVTKTAWDRIVYRKLSERKSGRPSFR